MRFAVAAAGLVAVVSASVPAYPTTTVAVPEYPVSTVAVPEYSAPTYGPVKNHTTTAAPEHYTTEVVKEYTTYCPGPTSIVHGDKTYTVTSATTLTITDCPCTVTKPVYSSTSTYCPPTETHVPSQISSMPGVPVYTKPPTMVPSSPVTPSATAPPTYTGAANKASFGVAGLLAAAGLVAAL